MLKIKSIKKDGKYLKIVIKKPYFLSLKKFMQKHNLLFENDKLHNFNWGLTIDGDIQLYFILRNYDDIKPYLKVYSKEKEIDYLLNTLRGEE